MLATEVVNNGNTVQDIRISWVSDASGDATHTTTTISGAILRIVNAPDSGGTQPSDLYDVTISDADAVVLFTATNLSNATPTDNIPTGKDAITMVNGPLSIVVANAGNAKGGDIIIYYR